MCYSSEMNPACHSPTRRGESTVSRAKKKTSFADADTCLSGLSSRSQARLTAIPVNYDFRPIEDMLNKSLGIVLLCLLRKDKNIGHACGFHLSLPSESEGYV